jgi:curved DNA-binding protein CbpA
MNFNKNNINANYLNNKNIKNNKLNNVVDNIDNIDNVNNIDNIDNVNNIDNIDNIDNDDLFAKMTGNNNNKTKEDLEINKIIKRGFDYYKIVGVNPEDDIREIKKKYRQLLAKYHPDKLKSLSEDKRNKKLEQWKLIKMAGDVLTNVDKKKYYDLEQKVIKSKNFQAQKSSFEDFIKLQESENTEENRQRAKLEFEKEKEKINKLRGFDPNDKMDKIDKKEFSRTMDDLISRRDMQNIELTQKNLFENKHFSPEEFNKLFEKDKRKREKTLKKKQEKGEIIKFDEGFTAYNNVNSNFVSVDTDYSELFADSTEGNNLYGKLSTGLSDDNLSDNYYSNNNSNNNSNDNLNDNSDNDRYNNDYENHKLNKLETNDVYERFLEQRRRDNMMFDNMKHSEFKDVMNDDFGVSKDFGRILGADNFNTNINKNKKLDSNVIKAYNRLIKHDNDDDDE